jgi:hypothetical protein
VADLRELFHQLRSEEHAPPFRSAAARPRLSKRRFRAALRYALILMVIAIAAIPSLRHRRPPVTESIVTWKAPTDFLLQTPGSELLSTVPQIPERRQP